MRRPSLFTRRSFNRRRPAACRLRLDELERREVPADLANVESNLAALYRLSQPDQVGDAADSAAQLRGHFLQDAGGRPVVQIWTRGDTDAALAGLQTLGVRATLVDADYHLIEASLDLALLPDVAALPDVRAVTPAYRPVPRAGSVQTQGDGVVRADLVRSAGFDGASVKVGVIGDSTLNIAVSRVTGDLPNPVDRYLEFAGTDEGRAMLEVIHDLAPGAALASYSGVFSAASFAKGVRTLAAAGCHVIVDALGYLDQPFFQDGIIARAVNEVTAAGVVYVSAAGNDADLSYESAFVDADPGSSADFHDVDPGPGVDTRQRITVPRGLTNALVLQWDDPFYTAGGVSHNFDVKVYDDGNSVVASGTTNNLTTQQPLEVVTWSTTGTGSANFHVEIERKAGTGPSLLKYLLLAGTGATVAEFATNSGTVYGQAAAAGAVAVGAVPYHAPGTIEPYSSRGDATIYFAPDGTRLGTPEVRRKPDVVAPDAVNTTFFGTDIPEDADTFPNFRGTSAAAPHVAGVAALVLQANPHLTRDELVDVLTATALDLGGPGRDNVYGHGLVDAHAARLAAQAVPDVTAPTAELVSPIVVHGWHATRLTVQFSEPLHPPTAANLANYSLACAGPDAAFGTGDDFSFTLSPNYDAGARTVTLTVAAPFASLPVGQYRLTLNGTNGLTDPAGNGLNAGADQVIALTIATRSAHVQVETEPPLPSPITLIGSPQLDVRPDGTAVMVYANNPAFPAGSFEFWPQVSIGQHDAGAAAGPYRVSPTDIIFSNGVDDVDVAVNATGGVYIYRQLAGMDKLAYQLLDADGRPVGPRRVVGTVLNRPSRVDINAAGAFAMAYGTLGHHFGADGLPLGPAFTIDQQGVPVVGTTVAIDNNGGTVFTWEAVFDNGNADEIHARRFDASGSPLGDEFRVNTTTTGRMAKPEIAMAADGSFVVAWNATEGPAGAGGVLFQRHSADGTLLGSETQISSQVFNGQAVNSPQAQVAMAADGRFVVVWRQDDGDGKGIFAQEFAADGAPLGTPIWVSQGAAGDQTAPRVGMADNGDYVVRWRNADDTDAAVWVSAFAANGAPSLTTVGTLAGGTEETPYPIAYSDLAIAADEADPDGTALVFRIEGVTSGVLTKDGVDVIPGETLVSAGDSLVWTPPADASGTVNAFTVRAWDGTLASATPVPVPVALADVNDAPSFTGGSDESIREDAGPRSVPNWATAISPGPIEESGQSVGFEVTTSNDGLFAALPAIDADGILTYTIADDVNGSATVSVRVKDDGLTANGGDDTSDPQTFTIQVDAVNDPPAFTRGGDLTVPGYATPQTVPAWASTISAGPPDEVGQGLTFQLTTNNHALFASLPAISPTGTLTFTPNAGAHGSATVSVTLADDGGTALGGSDTSPTQTFTIAVQPTVVIEQATGQTDPAIAGPIVFDVTFSADVTGFDLDDVDLSGSTVGGTLGVVVTPLTPSTYSVRVSGMQGTGTVVAKIKPDAAVDAFGIPSAGSTSADNVVSYSSAGVIGWSSNVYAGVEGGSIVITARRIGEGLGAVSVDYSLTGVSATAGPDYGGVPVTGRFDWADGNMDDQSITINIVDDNTCEFDETVSLTLANPAGTLGPPLLGTLAATATIARSDPLGSGTTFTDDDRDVISVKLVQPKLAGGSVAYYLTDGKGPLQFIELAGTDSNKTSLNVGVRRFASKTAPGDGLVKVGAIEGTGVLALNLARSPLVGTGIHLTGMVRTVKLDSIRNGADVVAAGTNGTKGTRIAVKGAIGDGTTIDLDVPLNSLTAASFGTGLIDVPRIGSLAVRGNFRADITASGQGVDPVKGRAIGSLRIAGVVQGVRITAGGNVGSVSVGEFRDSRLFANYAGADNGTGIFNLSSPAAIGSFKTVRSRTATGQFAASSVIAASIGTVTLTDVAVSNGNDRFGIFADLGIQFVAIRSTKKTLRNPTLFTDADFAVQVV